MKNILQYLEKTANNDKTAIIEEDRKITYKELLNKSKMVGTKLLDYISLREPVGIFMDKGIDALGSFFGAVYAGGFYIYLNPDLPIARLQKIVEVAEIKVIISNDEFYQKAQELSNTVFKQEKPNTVLKIEEIEGQVDEEKLQEVRNKVLDVDPLYANFTSGSTGEPKGVIVSHRSVIDFINVFCDKFDITEKDVIANQAPFDFDVSVKDIYSSIKTGSCLLIVPKKLFSAPAKLLDYLCDNNATTLIWAVSALCLITTFHGLDYKVPTSVEKVLFSGEVMPIKHIKQWVEHLPNAQFVNLYGPTEITCNCTYHVVDKSLNYEKQIPMGIPFDNEEVFLLDDNNQKIEKEDVVGEICVKGTALSLGYYNNCEQTNKYFVQKPLNTKYIDMIYRTGDLGYIKNNEFYFCGRKDFQIKHMGHRIELEEIELEINKVEGIVRSCCIYDDEKSRLYGYYIGNIEPKELHSKLAANLPIFMIPNVLKQIDEFPLNKNGKIDRKKLKEQKNGK